MERLLFDVAAGLAILFASVMVLHRHPVKSVLALVVSFFALATCFVLLSAPLIAAIQVIVYAGAILVLFLFVLMLLNIPAEIRQKAGRPIHHFLSGVALITFGALLLEVLRSHGTAAAPLADRLPLGEIAPLARLLFSDYLLAFEALSILLLAALVGAFVLVGREKRA